MRPVIPAVFVVLCAVGATQLTAHDPITTKVTFNKEVLRILNRRCLGCHQTGGSAPMSLGTYADARPWAKAIKEEILERRMPPWNAAKGFGDYSNDRSLTPLELELLVDWVEGGAPKGDDKDIPKPKVTDDPTPDLVVTGAASPVVKAQTWITGWRFIPSSGAVTGADFWIEDAAHKRTYLGGWVPPEGMVSWPDDVAQSLPAGSTIVVKVHFADGDGEAAGSGAAAGAASGAAPSGPARSKLALYFADHAPKRFVRHMQLACGATPLGAPLAALSIQPAGPMEVEAIEPTGAVDPLGLFRPDKPDYHPTYFFRHPLDLPAGSRIAAHGSVGGACSAMLAYTALPKPPRALRQHVGGE